ncbi:hypothetical protein BJF95_04895 [Rhizobium oryziradicis]|uniref:Uncharacterized protein n=1 Tax=Rhizobium oryziradicis TaxID=1867956 RepID=A0A1Q8ZS94_9HYPH|nr:hypothetical protein BJF95_04895 [Rhizobium oryziradicis]
MNKHRGFTGAVFFYAKIYQRRLYCLLSLKAFDRKGRRFCTMLSVFVYASAKNRFALFPDKL